jgi:hypothetical protein
MEVSGQFHTSAVLPVGKEPTVPVDGLSELQTPDAVEMINL